MANVVAGVCELGKQRRRALKGSEVRLQAPRIAEVFLEHITWALCDRLGIAIAESTYAAYRDLLDSERWQRLENLGARTQRLLFASTGTKDPRAPDTLYIGALAAPNTINTIPEETLAHFADHGEVGGVVPRDGARARERRYRRSSRRASILMRWRRTSNPRALGRSTSLGATS